MYVLESMKTHCTVNEFEVNKQTLTKVKQEPIFSIENASHRTRCFVKPTFITVRSCFLFVYLLLRPRGALMLEQLKTEMENELRKC